MATKIDGANGTRTVEEIRNFAQNNVNMYANAADALRTLRDANKTTSKSISSFTKEDILSYISSIGSNEKNLRNASRYLYYKSHVYARLVQFYANMFDLRCRKVVPQYDITKGTMDKNVLKNYNATLDQLDLMNIHNNITPVLTRCFIEDVAYCLFFSDDNGSFFYILDPDECIIDTQYMTGDFGFALDMSKWTSTTRQNQIEWLGEPLTSMYREYESTRQKYIHVPDEYGVAFKFRTDDWQTVVPPMLSLFMSLINLEDLADVQAIADAQQVYKLVYLPMKVLSGAKNADDFEVTPDLLIKYFNKMLDEALPDYVAGAVVPGDKLETIDFKDNAASDVDRLEQAATTVLNTSGGGMVLNTSKITTQAGFEAALKCETEYAISTLIPQINGFVNRMLKTKLGDKAAKVEHFEVSIYTKDKLAEDLLKSCQYSFANRLAYNTCLGFSEKDTIALIKLENEVLGLPDAMIHPLSSSFTNTGTEDGYTSEVGQGAPTKDASELSDAGSKSRDN